MGSVHGEFQTIDHEGRRRTPTLVDLCTVGLEWRLDLAPMQTAVQISYLIQRLRVLSQIEIQLNLALSYSDQTHWRVSCA